MTAFCGKHKARKHTGKSNSPRPGHQERTSADIGPRMGLRQQTGHPFSSCPLPSFPSLRPKQPQICFLNLGFWPFCVHGVTGVGPSVCGLRHGVLEDFWEVGAGVAFYRGISGPCWTKPLPSPPARSGPQGSSSLGNLMGQRCRGSGVTGWSGLHTSAANPLSDYGEGEAGLSRGGENFQIQGPEGGGNLGSEELILLGSCPTPPHPFSLSPYFPPCCSQERTHQLHFHEGTANTTQCLPSQWILTFNTALHNQRNECVIVKCQG